MTPYFQDQFLPLQGAIGEIELCGRENTSVIFSSLLFLSFSLSSLRIIIKKKHCVLWLPLSSLVMAENRVRKREMMTKFGLPIVTLRQANCDSRTPIFCSASFLGEMGCDVLQVASVGPVISLYPLPAMIGDQCGIGFENGERVMITVERRSLYRTELRTQCQS